MPRSPTRAGCVRAGGGVAVAPAADVFALSEVGGSLVDLGPTSPPTRMHCAGPSCGSRVRAGAWTVRFASLISDEPRALHWDTAGLLVVAYGFHTYGLETATGDARWNHRSATPILALLGSPRLRARPRRSRARDVRHRSRRDRRLAGRPLGRRDRRRARRRPARPDELRRPGQRARPGDGPQRPDRGRPTGVRRCGRRVDNRPTSARFGGRVGLTRPGRGPTIRPSPERPSDTNG